VNPVLPRHEGASVTQVIREAGFDGQLAPCGGGCSCATCSVHVAEDSRNRLPATREDENHLPDSSSDRDGNSRLACLIAFSDALGGPCVTLAAED
jgi:2Fe-2S ferredoxin